MARSGQSTLSDELLPSVLTPLALVQHPWTPWVALGGYLWAVLAGHHGSHAGRRGPGGGRWTGPS